MVLDSGRLSDELLLCEFVFIIFLWKGGISIYFNRIFLQCPFFFLKKSASYINIISIIIFLVSSVYAGISHSMTQLTFARAIQGVGAGGNFALAYIVLADISPPERRGKMMSLISFVWGLSSVLGLFILTLCSGVVFYTIERHAKEPILPIGFFQVRGFSIANSSAFFASIAIFSLSAYSPLFIQGALGKTPAQLGLAMVPLSLGWSMGALLCGQIVHLLKEKPSTLLGAFLLLIGCGLTLSFSISTSLTVCSIVLAIAGLGMGFVSISTLLIVQNNLPVEDLGIATASHQFSRTLGGTIGIGISGSIVTTRLQAAMDVLRRPGIDSGIHPSLSTHLQHNLESLFRPEIQSLLSENVQKTLREAVVEGVTLVFWISLITACICLLLSYRLPE
jgi:MFS family permease